MNLNVDGKNVNCAAKFLMTKLSIQSSEYYPYTLSALKAFL